MQKFKGWLIAIVGFVTLSLGINQTVNAASLTNQVNQYESTISYLNNQAPWKLDSMNQNLIAQTYGSEHNIVYYQMENNVPAKFQKQMQVAIARWNALGVLKLVASNDTNLNRIKISYGDDPHQEAADNASANEVYSFMEQAKDPNVMLDAHIYIEKATNKNLKHDAATNVNVFTHELGHALGFEHNNNKFVSATNKHRYAITLMYGGTSNKLLQRQFKASAVLPLGSLEADALRQHYNLK